MLRVLIVDDHPLIRKGLRQILVESVHIGSVQEASDGFEAVEAVRNGRFDVVVLDISIPGKDGMEVLRDIKEIAPDTPVLMLSIQPEEQYALRAFRLGASGCLNKSGAPDELIEAIRAVASGGSYVSQAASKALVSGIKNGDGRPPHLLLSEREHQVMLMLAGGSTVGEAATSLKLSVKTVSTYRARILEKMNLANNAQLTQYAYRHKLIL
ncbi:MAG: DNA-binding response regulator [Spirochaetae bacterium HGW-Spirochaetae-3]|jgi:DNA-binding NarL/FixJ family response regulator|nr:MAG: DNA-binding response regulator [Spirochaetae bacterium HGW-Spirochaetae-3]